MGLLLLALINRLTRKRVIVFFDCELVAYFVFLELISDILRNGFFVSSHRIHVISLTLELSISILILQIRMSIEYHQ